MGAGDPDEGRLGDRVRHLNGIRQFSFVDKDELAVVDDGDTERSFRDYDMMAEEHAAGTVACTRLSLGPSRVPRWRACMREALICDTDGDHVLTGTCADRAVLALGGFDTVDELLGQGPPCRAGAGPTCSVEGEARIDSPAAATRTR